MTGTALTPSSTHPHSILPFPPPPTDAGTHANLGFTFHLMGRHEAAIEAYHQALALQPTFSFAADMLSRAMEDYTMAGDGDGGDERMGAAGEGGGGGIPAHLQFDLGGSDLELSN